MPYSLKIREEELKNKVAADFFADYDWTQIVGNIDFCVSARREAQASFFEGQALLWAEAKKGNKHDIYASFVQLILTIGKARTFDTYIPPVLLGAFDAEKIAFVPYHSVMEVFHQNDFNWNVTPSDHESKEFKQLYALVKTTVEENLLLFRFGEDDARLREYIRRNFKEGGGDNRIEIDKNNFVSVYFHWRENVMPSINVVWEKSREKGILEADFYLADLISQDNTTLRGRLYVQLKKDHYELDRALDDDGLVAVKTAGFTDGQKAHTQFWNLYRRPPSEIFWDYMVERRHLLVPQDVRERKGSYFTPRQWVELSQQYLADVLGEDWQDEYTVWDCAAGTGNLLAGLTNKYNIWASTIDQADVDVMKDRIANGANLLESHVFKFDFLNDSFDKCPEGLREIIENPEKRKKLVIYINPPYAEHGNKRQVAKTGENKSGVAVSTIYTKYQPHIGTAARELFAQFLIRIHEELRGCHIGQFSKLKHLQASNFAKFRTVFTAKLEKLFLVPSMTFDNVKGQFPIGFFVWDTAIQANTKAKLLKAHVYNAQGSFIRKKTLYRYDRKKLVIEWLRKFYDMSFPSMAYLHIAGTDIQHANYIFISNYLSENDIAEKLFTNMTANNIIETSIYCVIRQVIKATWLNDRDQFLYPNDTWATDVEFQTDCLAYTLFTNVVSVEHGTNHWIPFRETEVDAKEKFASHFMTDYMSGKLGQKAAKESKATLVPVHSSLPTSPLLFSDAATAVFDAGRELWKYYHVQPGANVNAALYDIKRHFQGRNDKGRMRSSSDDATYTQRMDALRDALATLAAQIAPKVYAHGFLRE